MKFNVIELSTIDFENLLSEFCKNKEIIDVKYSINVDNIVNRANWSVLVIYK